MSDIHLLLCAKCSSPREDNGKPCVFCGHTTQGFFNMNMPVKPIKNNFIEKLDETKRFEYTDNKSNKFWSIGCFKHSSKLDTLVGLTTDYVFRVNYGRIGTDGLWQEKKFYTELSCVKAANKKIAEKLNKGYVLAVESLADLEWDADPPVKFEAVVVPVPKPAKLTKTAKSQPPPKVVDLFGMDLDISI